MEREVYNMWLLVLIISIKLQMPTWYWSIFTIITLIRPIVSIVNIFLEDEIKKSIGQLKEDK